MAIKPAAARALCDAMERLLQGKPLRTDGRLTWVNVYTEACVPRATAARAKDLIESWQNALNARSDGHASPVPAEELIALKSEMEAKASQAAATHKGLRATIRTMANHIQALSLVLEGREEQISSLRAQVSSLQAQLAALGGNVIPLKKL